MVILAKNILFPDFFISDSFLAYDFAVISMYFCLIIYLEENGTLYFKCNKIKGHKPVVYVVDMGNCLFCMTS